MVDLMQSGLPTWLKLKRHTWFRIVAPSLAIRAWLIMTGERQRLKVGSALDFQVSRRFHDGVAA